MGLRAFFGLFTIGSAVAAAIVACSSFTASKPDGSADATVDASSCVRSVFAPTDPADAGLPITEREGGTSTRTADGIVFGAATGEQAFAYFQIPARERVNRLVVEGRLTAAATSDEEWSPLAVIAATARLGVPDEFPGTLLVSLDDQARAKTTFVAVGAATFDVTEGAVGSFPSREEVPFRLVLEGRWRDGLNVGFTSNGQDSSLLPSSPRPRISEVPGAQNSLNIVIGVPFGLANGSATLTLHELAIEVCTE